jgi:hypothetical protein
LLKWHYQPERRQSGHSWYTSIANHRREIGYVVEDSPSLRRLMPELLTKEYAHARRIASAETGLPLSTFPEACPWTLEQVVDEEFWPDEPA